MKQRSKFLLLKLKEETMKANMGTADKIIRIILGIVLIIIALAVAMSTVLEIILLVVGIILLITSITGFCALYKLLGINTLKKQ